MSNANNKKPVTQENTEKKMTKYDRKMQARKEAELKEKKRSLITKICVIAAAAVIILVAVLTPVVKKQNAKKEYIRIGNHSVNQIDFNFYYGYTVNTFLNTYASILPYMGLDTTASFASQMFSETLTWENYFKQMTASNIRQYFALADDAAAKGYEYDVTEDYNEFYKNMSEAASEDNISLKTYLKNAFGSYATKASIEDSVKTFLTAQSYYTYLLEQNTPSDEEIAEYYEENKNSYDTVSYRVFGIAADAAEDASDEEKAAALVTAKEKAEKFAERYAAGEIFPELCLEYATEKNIDTYKDETASLKENVSYSATSSVYRDWLFAAERTEGNVTVLTDDTNNISYVVAFLSRECADTVNDTISDTLASKAAQEYVSELTQNYTITDEKNNLHLDLVSDNNGEEDSADDSSEDNNTEEDNSGENNADTNDTPTETPAE